MQQMVLYCKTYCSLNMFRAPLAHHQELKSIIQVVAACGTWCFGLQVVGLVWSCRLYVRFAGCCSRAHITYSSTHLTTMFGSSMSLGEGYSFNEIIMNKNWESPVL